MQSPRDRQSPRAISVVVVSKNQGTLDELEGYLQRAGAMTHGTRRIEQSAGVIAESAAIVVFPDEFGLDSVIAALRECGQKNPRALPILVTRSPQRFEAIAWPDGTQAPLLVPRPAWGWRILDAVRAHLEAT